MKQGRLPTNLNVVMTKDVGDQEYTGRDYVWLLGYVCRWTRHHNWACRYPVINANLHMPRNFTFNRRDLRQLAKLVMAMYWRDDSKVAAATEQGLLEITTPAPMTPPGKYEEIVLSPRLLRDFLAGVSPINVPFGFGLKPRIPNTTSKRSSEEQRAITLKLCEFYSEIDPGLVDEDCEAEYLDICNEILKHAKDEGYAGFRWSGPSNGILIRPQYLTEDNMNRARRILLGEDTPTDASRETVALNHPVTPTTGKPTVHEVCHRNVMDQVTETISIIEAKGAHTYYHRVLRYQNRTIYQGTAYTPNGPWVAYQQDTLLLAGLGLNQER